LYQPDHPAAASPGISQGGRFDGFVHVDDWVPQRLVSATGPNPPAALTKPAAGLQDAPAFNNVP